MPQLTLVKIEATFGSDIQHDVSMKVLTQFLEASKQNVQSLARQMRTLPRCGLPCPQEKSAWADLLTWRVAKRSYMIQKHAHVVTATEVKEIGSSGVMEELLRFRSLDEMVAYFSGLGVPATSLEIVRQSVDSTGMATLVVVG